ncbi:MAG: GAF domain-containing sensor histidine kinase [Bacteroidota bacterium]|nr:GAF domain-containing sensor histidine kinase [Candidatus Kapabacteria bacterium]MDW8219597.1 GAF domain-containing sensor histidine kinase [Bacteroidota bacterium]
MSAPISSTMHESQYINSDHSIDISRLGEIGQSITSSLDLETILTTVHKNVRELMPADIFGIAIYREWGEIEYQYYVEAGKLEYMPSALMDEKNSFAVWAVEHSKEVVVQNCAEEYKRYVETLRPEETKAASQMYFPLITKNQPLGLITVQAFQESAYTDRHIAILRTIASYAAVAIDNLNSYARLANAAAEMEVMNHSLRELNEKMQKINQDISTLSAMGQKITSTLDYETILSATYQSVSELLDVATFGLGVARDNVIEYLLFMVNGHQSYHVPISLDDDTSLAVRSIRERREIVLNDVQNEYTQYVPRLRAEEAYAQSLVYFPLVVKNRPVGVLTVQSTSVNAYSKYQIDMMRTIATYTATAIDNIYAYSYLATAFAETESTRAEIAQLNKHLVELDNEKNEFLGIVAHDLKNPLSGIRMLAKVLYDQGDMLEPKEIKDLSNDILSSAGRMFDLITNLLDINAIERGAVKVYLCNFDLTLIVKALCDNYFQRAQAKNITIHFHAEEHVKHVFADQNATIQVLDNLISNAVKYSPYDRNIWVRCSMHGDNFVRCEVKDEGPGLTEEDKKKLFGKFARLSAQPTGGEHSTGLGLSIVKKMAEAMGGRVWCESEYGHGASFFLELPAAQETLESVEDKA